MKRILIAKLCLVSMSLFSSERSQPKRQKPNTASSVATVAVTQNQNPAIPAEGFSGFDHMPDEITLNSLELLIRTNNPCDWVNFKRVSKRFYNLASDEQLIKKIQNPIMISLINPSKLNDAIKQLSDNKKIKLLTLVEELPHTQAQRAILQKLERVVPPFFQNTDHVIIFNNKVVESPFSQKFIDHTIILKAIRESDLQLFTSCRRLLNMHPISPLAIQANYAEQLIINGFRGTARLILGMRKEIADATPVPDPSKTILVSNAAEIVKKLSY